LTIFGVADAKLQRILSNDTYCTSFFLSSGIHEPELLFTHRLKLGFVHPPRLPGDVNRFFRSRTGRYRCSPDRFLDYFYAFRHRLHRADTNSTATNVTTQTDLSLRDPPTEIGFLGLIVVARPKRCPQWTKRLHIPLTGSRAVTNRHTSEAQSPAPGTSCFEIEWDILEGRERSWGLGFGSFFFVFDCVFCVSVNLPVFWLHNLVLHKPFVRYQNSK
jgi:hypothetical protein